MAKISPVIRAFDEKAHPHVSGQRRARVATGLRDQIAALCEKSEALRDLAEQAQNQKPDFASRRKEREDEYYTLGREAHQGKVAWTLKGRLDREYRYALESGAMDALVTDNRADNMVEIFNTERTYFGGAVLISRLVNEAGADDRNLEEIIDARIEKDKGKTRWVREALRQSLTLVESEEGVDIVQTLMDNLPDAAPPSSAFEAMPSTRRPLSFFGIK